VTTFITTVDLKQIGRVPFANKFWHLVRHVIYGVQFLIIANRRFPERDDCCWLFSTARMS